MILVLETNNLELEPVRVELLGRVVHAVFGEISGFVKDFCAACSSPFVRLTDDASTFDRESDVLQAHAIA